MSSLPKGGKLTGLVWLGALAGLGAYEVYALRNKESKDTLSEGYWRASAKLPVLNLFLGILVGHFAWQSVKVYEEFRNEED